MPDTFKIQSLEQVRLLSDPLKLRLLLAFAEGDKTTKKVAAELGENITKMYRHVDALHDAGLLVVVKEKRKRGTIERTFRAVAERFEADQSLFTDESGGDGIATAREVLRVSENEILNALREAEPGKEPEPILMRLRAKATPERIAELRRTLKEWIQSTQEENDVDDTNVQEIGALIAFYPIASDDNN